LQLDIAGAMRQEEAPIATRKHKARADKAQLGQFMTPVTVARFMASLFPPGSPHTCRLLDAGAGRGALTCAFLHRWRTGGFGFASVEVTACEIDDHLRGHLAQRLAGYSNAISRIIPGDYIHMATAHGLRNQGYTHVILNPPYRKISGHSAHRLALRRVGIETVNLYSAFVALAVAEAAAGGQIVAIIPRSFCSGPYYRPFRNFILARAAIRHMHLFASRNQPFRGDQVLQETIILRLERGGQQGPVTVSTSTDDSFADLATHEHPFERIVPPDTPEQWIHVPTTPEKTAIERLSAVGCFLTDLGVRVSTGPVVDFRLRSHLRPMPEAGAVPLIYPGHLRMGRTVWPIAGLKKSNAIIRNNETEKWLYPNGFYCAVRRFSSKEEKRRVVASLIDPAAFGKHSALGFENHINLFHENRHGLPETLARGLALFLNTTAVDEYFRRFNGHTQVNATDLKLMQYPSRKVLIQLGTWAMGQGKLTQDQMDVKLETLAQ